MSTRETYLYRFSSLGRGFGKLAEERDHASILISRTLVEGVYEYKCRTKARVCVALEEKPPELRLVPSNVIILEPFCTHLLQIV